jgi:hypothetical protein
VHDCNGLQAHADPMQSAHTKFRGAATHHSDVSVLRELQQPRFSKSIRACAIHHIQATHKGRRQKVTHQLLPS